MSDSGKAVFLSYASQDASAAKRICDALRAAGVEVWFDQSELRGGDAWDAMIRKRIKECALFVPIITPNTNARAEGYFRLEWKLAVDRSHLMADDAPFLFPVVLGDVTDATARVPDKFREVQWTRLRLDETPGELAARVARLLSGTVGASLDEARGRAPGAPLQKTPGRWQWWMIFPIIGTVMGLLFAVAPLWKTMNRPPRPEPPAAAVAPAATPPVAAMSPARRLAEKARVLLDAIDSTADDYATAEGLLKRALELEPNDGEIWAISSRLNSMFMSRAFDNSDARREPARSQAERALKLAPDSVETLLAVARANRNTDAPRAEAALRQALALAPHDGRVLLNLGSLFRVQNRLDEAMTHYEQAAAVPEVGSLARYDQFLVSFYRRKFADAERYVQESVAALPTANSVTGLAMVKLTWRGQPEEALRVLAAAPGKVRAEPRPVIVTVLAAQMNRQPEVALAALRRFPADYVNDAWYFGPKALLVGLCERQAGRPEAARVAWESGIALLRRRMQDSPNNADEHLRLGELLAWSGQTEAALAEVKVYEQLMSSRTVDWTASPARVYAALGRADEAVPLLAKELVAPPTGRWPLTPALLRLDPLWDKIRGDPRFQQLCEEPAVQTAAPAAKADEKSVAVLAFANLSDDKANEYFSDGISEELLNVLAKVPGLKVAARTSAFYFKGKEVPIPEIARQLGVAYVVEGSVRKAGDKVRITAQLIKAGDGFHVWSETFTRDLKDIFAVQDEIAALIAQNLRTKMAITRERTAPDPEVYALILRARHAKARETNDGAREASALYQQALARSPKSADAWAELALSYVQLGRFGGLPTAEGMREARIAARRALELEAEHPLGLLALAWVQRTNDRDWRGAIASFRRALAAAPENVTIMSDASICFLNVGFVAEAEALAAQAVARDPLNARAQWSLGAIYLWSGRPILAVDSYRRASELAPNGDEYHSHLSRALAMAGRFPEALREAQLEPNERYRLVAMATLQYISGDQAAGDRTLKEIVAKYGDSMAGYLANLSAAAGKNDEVFRWLERGYETRDAAMAWIKTNAGYRSVTSDPRWEQFLRKMGLADDQLK